MRPMKPCARCGVPKLIGGNSAKQPVCKDCRETDPWWLKTANQPRRKASA